MCTGYKIIAMSYFIFGVAVQLSRMLMHTLLLAMDHIRNCNEKFSVVGEDELVLCRVH